MKRKTTKQNWQKPLQTSDDQKLVFFTRTSCKLKYNDFLYRYNFHM